MTAMRLRHLLLGTTLLVAAQRAEAGTYSYRNCGDGATGGTATCKFYVNQPAGHPADQPNLPACGASEPWNQQQVDDTFLGAYGYTPGQEDLGPKGADQNNVLGQFLSVLVGVVGAVIDCYQCADGSVPSCVMCTRDAWYRAVNAADNIASVHYPNWVPYSTEKRAMCGAARYYYFDPSTYLLIPPLAYAPVLGLSVAPGAGFFVESQLNVVVGNGTFDHIWVLDPDKHTFDIDAASVRWNFSSVMGDVRPSDDDYRHYDIFWWEASGIGSIFPRRHFLGNGVRCMTNGNRCIEALFTANEPFRWNTYWADRPHFSWGGRDRESEADKSHKTPRLDQQMCTYGPLVYVNAHGQRPEIHPMQLAWWHAFDFDSGVVNQDQWYFQATKDASDHFVRPTNFANFTDLDHQARDWQEDVPAPVGEAQGGYNPGSHTTGTHDDDRTCNPYHLYDGAPLDEFGNVATPAACHSWEHWGNADMNARFKVPFEIPLQSVATGVIPQNAVHFTMRDSSDTVQPNTRTRQVYGPDGGPIHKLVLSNGNLSTSQQLGVVVKEVYSGVNPPSPLSADTADVSFDQVCWDQTRNVVKGYVNFSTILGRNHPDSADPSLPPMDYQLVHSADNHYWQSKLMKIERAIASNMDLVIHAPLPEPADPTQFVISMDPIAVRRSPITGTILGDFHILISGASYAAGSRLVDVQVDGVTTAFTPVTPATESDPRKLVVIGTVSNLVAMGAKNETTLNLKFSTTGTPVTVPVKLPKVVPGVVVIPSKLQKSSTPSQSADFLQAAHATVSSTSQSLLNAQYDLNHVDKVTLTGVATFEDTSQHAGVGGGLIATLLNQSMETSAGQAMFGAKPFAMTWTITAVDAVTLAPVSVVWSAPTGSSSVFVVGNGPSNEASGDAIVDVYFPAGRIVKLTAQATITDLFGNRALQERIVYSHHAIARALPIADTSMRSLVAAVANVDLTDLDSEKARADSPGGELPVDAVASHGRGVQAAIFLKTRIEQFALGVGTSDISVEAVGIEELDALAALGRTFQSQHACDKSCTQPPSGCVTLPGFCDDKGACQYSPKPAMTACDDGLASTTGESCNNHGQCFSPCTASGFAADRYQSKVVTLVNAADARCWQSGWDASCVSELRTVGKYVACDEAVGSCKHGVCAAGVALTSGCDRAQVASTICGIDSYCCTVAWDAYCVAEVATIATKTCVLN